MGGGKTWLEGGGWGGLPGGGDLSAVGAGSGRTGQDGVRAVGGSENRREGEWWPCGKNTSPQLDAGCPGYGFGVVLGGVRGYRVGFALNRVLGDHDAGGGHWMLCI